MPAPWLQNIDPAMTGCMAQGGRPPRAVLVLVPAAMYFARTYGTAFLGIEPASAVASPSATPSAASPQPDQQLALVPRPDLLQYFVANAHSILQRLMGRLPNPLLFWFFTKVLNLSPDTSEETVQFLKTQAAQAVGGNPPRQTLEAAAETSAVQQAEEAQSHGRLAATSLSHGHHQQLLQQLAYGSNSHSRPAPEPWSSVPQALVQEARPLDEWPQPHQLLPSSGGTNSGSPPVVAAASDHQAVLEEKIRTFANQLMIMADANQTAAQNLENRREASRASKQSRRRGRRSPHSNRSAHASHAK